MGEDWGGGGGGGRQITSKGDNLLRSNLPLGDILLRGAGYFVTGHGSNYCVMVYFAHIPAVG